MVFECVWCFNLPPFNPALGPLDLVFHAELLPLQKEAAAALQHLLSKLVQAGGLNHVLQRVVQAFLLTCAPSVKFFFRVARNRIQFAHAMRRNNLDRSQQNDLPDHQSLSYSNNRNHGSEPSRFAHVLAWGVPWIPAIRSVGTLWRLQVSRSDPNICIMWSCRSPHALVESVVPNFGLLIPCTRGDMCIQLHTDVRNCRKAESGTVLSFQ